MDTKLMLFRVTQMLQQIKICTIVLDIIIYKLIFSSSKKIVHYT